MTTQELLTRHAALVKSYETVDQDHSDKTANQRAGIRAGIARKLTREIEIELELANAKYEPFAPARKSTTRHSRSDADLLARLSDLETLAADSARRPAIRAVAQSEADKVRSQAIARGLIDPPADAEPKPAAKSAKVAKVPLKRTPKSKVASVGVEATFAPAAA